MKKIIFLFIAFINCTIANAQEYNVQSINKDLLSNADLVIRLNSEKITVLNTKKIVYSVKRVITVLNAKGNDLVQLDISFNSVTKIDKINATVYDKQGGLIKKYTRKNMYEYANSYENTLAQDIRHLSFAYVPMSYPYTIEYNYTLELSQSLFLPIFYSKPYKNCSVEKLNFSVVSPKINPVITKQIDTRNKILNTESANSIISTYVDSAIKVMDENNSVILLKLNEFDLYGNAGSLKDWESLGSFYFELNKNRNELPLSYKTKLLEKIKNREDTVEKIKVLYKLLQDDFRYVSIQLGVGGWQCMDALTTQKNGYGDCKALSNLMCAMLEVAGIKSYVSLIYAKKLVDPLSPDFPMSYFNHVIVCVPLSADTIWLECTNNISNFNYLNSYTANKYTLLVKPTKSVLIKTPNIVHDSIISSHIYTIKDAKLFYSVNASFTAEMAERLYSLIINKNKKEKDYFILQTYNVNNSGESNLRIIDSPVPKVNLVLNSDQLNLITKNTKRLYLKLNKSNISDYNFEKATINSTINSLTLIDTISISIPENYVLESKLKNFNLHNTLGEYEIKTNIDKGFLMIYKNLNINTVKLTKVNMVDYENLILNFKNKDIEELIFILKD